jgi:hypothetical protein
MWCWAWRYGAAVARARWRRRLGCGSMLRPRRENWRGGVGSLSRAGIAGPAPGRCWPSSPELRLSLAQRLALRLQLAPGWRARPAQASCASSSRQLPRPAAGERAWGDDTRRLHAEIGLPRPRHAVSAAEDRLRRQHAAVVTAPDRRRGSPPLITTHIA